MRTRLVVILGAAGLALAPAGCVSLKRTPEARFFVLHATLEPKATASPGVHGVVGLMPVRVPGHLDRPQIVVWAAPNELRIDEFLRWAEPLDAGVARTLSENLTALLPTMRIIRWPWPASAGLRCRVSTELRVFGPQPGGEVRLEGTWDLLPPNGERPLARRSFALARPLPGAAGGDPGRGVEAMSELLADLARQIAEGVEGLSPERDATPPPSATGEE
jgi:uncharacterized lipoprotein YmbA